MICDDCRERDAVVQYTAVKDNNVVQLHLCEQCAAERGVETTVNTLPKHPLGEFLNQVQQQLAVSPADGTRCSFCGTTMADFRATGRWGCARCYTQFENGVRELLRRVHGHARHIGRSYHAPRSETLERSAVLGELREKLRRAIDNEQFEQAAELRDRIKGME
ncbi:MAG TPA: UvrB/UvrC motif-containing protein [Gemmatimonadaceae bacterium]|nr:UvrB/UvrC motif-containing protein [Gemmatimonadaceae bacterium]